MLNALHYSYGSLPTNAASPGGTLTRMGSDMKDNSTLFSDMSKDPAASFTVKINGNEDETNANVTRILVKAEHKFQTSASTTQTDKPYVVGAHMVIQFDKRYATVENIQNVLKAMLSALCNVESGSSAANILRIAQGER